jgi:hypothetical protein
MTGSGAPSDNTTLTAVLDQFAADGYAANMVATESGQVRCPTCRTESDPRDVSLHALRRLEGASEPDEMQAALAMSCPSCGERGAAVVLFGPQASPGEAAVLNALEDRRPQVGD